MKKILSMALILALCLALVPGAAATSGDFVIVDGVLRDYIGPGGAVTIPAGVTEIGPGAFYATTYNGNIVTSISIPSTVTKISSGAFQSLPALEEIVLPDSVTYLDSFVFQGCPKLRRVTLPKHLDYLGARCFADCAALTQVALPQSVDAIDYNSFTNTPWVKAQGEFATVDGILYAYNGSATAITVPAGVRAVACCFEETFPETSAITSITIPEGVTSICANAFMSCSSLKRVSLPSTLKSLGAGAFWGCSSLEEVVIPARVSLLSEQLFWGCTALKSVTIPAGVTSFGPLLFVAGSHYDLAQEKTVYDPLTGVTFHGAAGSAAQQYAQAMGFGFVADQPAGTAPTSGTAYPSTQAVRLIYHDSDGNREVREVTFHCYALRDANGNPTNYVRLRDVAQAITGSIREFAVDWDGDITLTGGAPYVSNGSELKQVFTGQQPYQKSHALVTLMGHPLLMDGILLTNAKGGGFNYYKLRDLGRAMGFNVSWDDALGRIVIDTYEVYSDAA